MMVLIYLCREGRESMERCEMCDDLYISSLDVYLSRF